MSYEIRQAARAAIAAQPTALVASISLPAPRSQAAEAPLALVASTVMIGVLLGVMDAAIVNVAIPTLSGSLGATADEAAWVATGYTLGMILVMPLNGWLTEHMGQKWYYLSAFGLFTIASCLCGFAGSIQLLIVLRIIQGLGGGALQPIALSILLRAAPPAKRGEMVAIFSLASIAPFALGPVIGGYILDNYSWPLLFLFKVPLCALGLALAYFVLGDDRRRQTHSSYEVSWPSFAAMGIGLASMQYVLSRGQREDWFDSSTITLLTVVTIITLGYFIWQQSRARRPFVNLRIFRFLPFSVGSFLTVISGFGLYGVNLVTPLFFQGPLRLPAYDTGVYLLQGAIATAVAVMLVSGLTRRIDARLVIVSGLAMFALGAWLMGNLDAAAGYWDVFWPRVLQGLALGLLFVPLMAVTLTSVPHENISDATGIATLVRYLGGNIGIAMLQLLQVRRAALALTIMAGSATLSNPNVADMVGRLGLQKTQLALSSIIAGNAGLISYLYLFRVSALIFALCIPLVFLLPKPAVSQ